MGGKPPKYLFEVIYIKYLSEETKHKRTMTFRKHMYEKAKNEIGNQYGKLKILEIDYKRTEENNSNGKHYGAFFKCECECGNVKSYRLNSLKTGHIRSCGCSKFNNPLIVDDLTGRTFGRLKVVKRDIERDKNEKGHRTHWLCKCSCGNPTLSSVTGYQLKSGHTQSCGCYASEQIAKRNQRVSTKHNSIRTEGDIIILKDDYGNECIIDKEDYNIVCQWYWRKIPKHNDINKGYWVTNSKKEDKYNKSTIMLHQIIAEIKYGIYDNANLMPDHLSRNTDDNRKCNILLKTNMKNCQNRGMSKANTSGKTGVSYNKEKNTWTAYITVDYKTIYLGDFLNVEDATKARIDAEQKYGFTCDEVVAPYDESTKH